MNIELKNVSIDKQLSEETICFAASVYVDGVKVGDASNRGQGGPTDVWFSDEGVEKKVQAYVATLPKGKLETGDGKVIEYELGIDGLIDRLVAKEDEKREFRRWCKKKLVFRLKGDRDGEYRTLTSPYSPEAKSWVVNKYGNDLDFILNERI